LSVKTKLFLLFMLFGVFQVNAQYTQEEIDSLLTRQFPDQEIDEVVVIYRDPKSQAKLRRDVLRAYPYALRVASAVQQINDHTDDIKKKRHKKRYLKKKEEILKKEFEENMKDLTKTQGRYMVRLIHRETDIVVYDMIKDYKGGLNATFWQLIAKKFDSDLKAVYEPNNTDHIDYEIEQIVSGVSNFYVQRIWNEIEIDPPTYRDFQKD